MSDFIDIGEGFSYTFFGWDPDRDLNPQYDGIPSIEKAGVVIFKDGAGVASCTFDTPETQGHPVRQDRPVWQLLSLEPLHIEPSIQMYLYDKDKKELVKSHHGYIRNGRWVNA